MAEKDKSTDEAPDRFAVYDVTYLRFVGTVHDSKAAAEKAAPKLEGHAYETRKV